MNGIIRVVVAVVVSAIWATSYIVSIINTHYHPAPEVNGIMLMVAGFFFASGLSEARKEQAKDEARREVQVEQEEVELERLRKAIEDKK